MSITATPIPSPALDLPAYLTVAAARGMLSGLSRLPGMDTLDAETDDGLAALLAAATMDLDAIAWAGSKADPDQALAFPRIAPGAGARHVHAGLPPAYWDWDDAEGASGGAVVPERVELACLFQAAHLTDGAHAARREAIRSGLASQSVGSVSESYSGAPHVHAGLPSGALGERAARLMDMYRTRSGAML